MPGGCPGFRNHCQERELHPGSLRWRRGFWWGSRVNVLAWSSVGSPSPACGGQVGAGSVRVYRPFSRRFGCYVQSKCLRSVLYLLFVVKKDMILSYTPHPQQSSGETATCGDSVPNTQQALLNQACQNERHNTIPMPRPCKTHLMDDVRTLLAQ